MTHERLEQVELAPGEIDGPCPSPHLPAGGIHVEVAELHRDARWLGAAAE